MAKGLSVKFKSYEATIPKILDVIGLSKELKKYDKIVLKPGLFSDIKEDPQNTRIDFVDVILKYIIGNKNPVAEVFIAEGSDGNDTLLLFDKFGYKTLAEKYDISLIDLNNSETEEINSKYFLKFSSIKYPKLLSESFLISLASLAESNELKINASIPNLVGIFPSKHYKGIFSKNKSKIRKWPIEYSIHDIYFCKRPNLSVIDASDKGYILVGQALEVDKQAAKILEKNIKEIRYLDLIEKTAKKVEEEKMQSMKKDNSDLALDLDNITIESK